MTSRKCSKVKKTETYTWNENKTKQNRALRKITDWWLPEMGVGGDVWSLGEMGEGGQKVRLLLLK